MNSRNQSASFVKTTSSAVLGHEGKTGRATGTNCMQTRKLHKQKDKKTEQTQSKSEVIVTPRPRRQVTGIP